MRTIFLLSVAFFLVSCGGSEERVPQLPPHIILSDATSQAVGMAVPLQDNIFVTADHLREKFGDIFWKEKRARVLSRDFEHDLMFIRFPEWEGVEPQWADTPPAVGDDIFWIDEFSSLETKEVHSISQQLSEESFQEDQIILSGTADLANSGSPIFDERGRIFGILVGGDKEKKLSFAVRSDVIMKILREHLE